MFGFGSGRGYVDDFFHSRSEYKRNMWKLKKYIRTSGPECSKAFWMHTEDE